MYITQKKQLTDLCSRLCDTSRIAVDVEFMREKTYFPILALVQVASEGICAAIDPIEIKSFDPLYEILHNPKIEKVFHASRQDLEIFFQYSGKPVQNIFDTQIAASLVGFGAQVSLMKLVEKTAGVRLEKTQQYTNWIRRPLSDCQIEYALNDVRYLLQSQTYLLNKLQKLKRDSWLVDEFATLSDPALYELPQPDNQYLKIKGIRSLKPRSLAILRELAAWRELEARKRNRYCNSIIREEALLGIAKRIPRTMEELSSMRGVELKQNGTSILEAIERGLAVPDSEVPELPATNNTGVSDGTEGLLWVYTQHRGKKLKISPSYLATRQEIQELTTLKDKNAISGHSLMSGWKKDLIGNDLLLLLEGKASLGIDSRTGNLKLIRANEPVRTQKDGQRKRG